MEENTQDSEVRMIPQELKFTVRIPVSLIEFLEEKKKHGVSYNATICNALHMMKKNEDSICQMLEKNNDSPF